MADRKPLVQIAGALRELPTADTMQLQLDAAAFPSVTPDAVALKISGAWVEISWASLLGLAGISPNAVRVNNEAIIVAGEMVVVR